MPTCYRHPGRESYIRCQRCGRTICPDCMTDASVGFHCPSCVAEGVKQTRANRTAYGGIRPTDASYTSGVLVAINVAVWFAVMATGGRASTLVDQLAIRANGLCVFGGQALELPAAVCTGRAGTYLPGVIDGAWWQLITNSFTHVQIWHIGFNMLALWILGPQLEMVVGRARFLALYLISAFSGTALVFWASSEYQATLGASGAIFGLLGALLLVAYKVGGDVRGILMWLGLNAVITIWGASFISWQGHLGGFLGGALVAAILVWSPRGPRRTTYQVAGLSLVTLLVAGAIVARYLMLT